MDEFIEEKPEGIEIATIQEIAQDGVRILVDGEDSAGAKKYKVNAMQMFSVGDRVKIRKNSGTYLVEYVIGNPMQRAPLPPGGAAGETLVKNSDNDYDVKWATPSFTAEELKNGTYTVALNSSGNLVPNSAASVSIGTSSLPFNNLYIRGTTQLGNSSGKLGFFGTSPISQQLVSNSANVATLISTLKSYGLIR